MTISRRDLLKGAAGHALAPLLPRAAAAVARAPFLVVVNCIGGNDGLYTVVPTHLSPYHDRRPTLALASSGLLDLDGRHMLHGALSRLQAFWLPGLRDRALLETLYSTGIRVSELVGLDLHLYLGIFDKVEIPVRVAGGSTA